MQSNVAQTTMANFFLWPRRLVRVRIFALLLFTVILLAFALRYLRISKFGYLTTIVRSKEDLRRKVTEENEERRRKSEAYFTSLSPKHSRDFYKTLEKVRRLEMVVAVVTVSRKVKTGDQKLAYLTQTLAAFDVQIKSFRSKTMSLFICNVNSPAEEHKEASNMSKYVPIVSSYPEMTKFESDIFEKEKKDYVFCLRKAAERNSNYVLLIEDDTIPRRNFFEYLEFIIRERLEKKSSWAFCKLYYPERWQGFSNNMSSVVELTFVFCLFGTLAVFSKFFDVRKGLDGNVVKMWVRFVSCGCLAVVLVWLFSRQRVLELRTLSMYTHAVVPAENCCTPAVLYQHDIAKTLADLLQMQTCHKKFPLDAAIDKVVADKKMQTFLVEPNMFQHIGMYSSLREKPKEAKYFL